MKMEKFKKPGKSVLFLLCVLFSTYNVQAAAPTGSVTIDNINPAEDDTLTASNDLADADGLSGPINYQWNRNGTPITGATETNYIVVQTDVGTEISVTASYIDDLSNPESVSSDPTAAVTNVNDVPTGSVTIDNTTPAEGDSLTASNSLADEDGLSGAISYQWFRGATPLSTGANYTVVAADIGSSLSVTASYTDDQGTAESVSSNPTSVVTDNVNVPPTGSVTINNTTPAEDDVLTAANTLADADGLGAISYEWRSGAMLVGSDTSYTLVQSDVGNTITVTARYTDDLGTAESVSSDPTAAVTNVNDAPTGSVTIDNTTPAEGDSLTASNSLADEDGLSGAISYQWFRGATPLSTGANYTVVAADIGSSLSVTASYTDDQGSPESVSSNPTSVVTDNVNVPPTGSVTINNTTPAEDDVLTAANTLADADGLGAISYEWRSGATLVGSDTSYTLVQSDVGNTITVTARYTDDLGTAESVSSDPTAAVTNVNDAPTGSVTIDNTTPAEGDSLTASNSLADEDGLSGAISYQWNRSGAPVSGATGNSYLLVQADVDSTITVTASYTDDLGTAEFVTSAATAVVTNVNNLPAGEVTINNMTPAEGDTLTVSHTLTDVDGLGVISYQWQRGGVNIAGATGSAYNTIQADVGMAISVVASYIDGEGTAESVTSDATAPVTNVNNPPTGNVTISGTATEDQTLTVTNSLVDTDGLGVISYQWRRGGINISGATGTSYILADADVGTMITVVASYTDSQGTLEVVSSTGAGPIININDAPIGVPVISGTLTEGQILTAVTSGITDADGLGAISYQWQRGGSDVSGATASTYALAQDDVGSSMTVTVSYTDGQGTAESVSSLPTAVVSNVNNPPTGTVTISGTPTEDQSLTAANTLVDVDGLGIISYQWQRSGINISAATGTSYTLGDEDVGTMITVVASYTDSQGTLEAVSSVALGPVANVNDVPSGSVIISGAAIENQTLTASNTLADNDGLTAISYQWNRNGSPVNGATGDSYLLGQADVDAIISVTASYTDGQGTDESVTSAFTGVVSNVNNSPSGLVSISGTASEGETLDASHNLQDVDGLGAISYQWNRSGSPISGANASSYLLVQADVGNTLTVTASYIDDQGTAESVTSAATAMVTNTNNAPTGAVTISGAPREDETLTASNTLADEDGLDSISYEWRRGVTPIATGSSYTPNDADVGNQITVVASYIDGGGTTESVSSTATSPIQNVNDEPTGAVTITGTASEGNILQASHTLADDDGLGAISYQWNRDASPIAGAIGSSYVLLQADVGNSLTVTASYIDDHDTLESVTSAATAVVTNVNNAPTGSVVINGVVAEDQTLTATNTLADVDGLGSITYQWRRGPAPVGTGSTYILDDPDVGKNITVTASYSDGGGTAESVTSSEVGPVANVNDLPDGLPVINGTASEGQSLTADSSSLSDADGLGAISYQWNRSGSPISGATGNSYQLVQVDVGSTLTVTVSYTDGQGTAESVTSLATAEVSNVNNPPTGLVSISGTASEGETLLASHNLQDVDGLGAISYQWNRSGSPVSGANGSSYLLVQADVSNTLTVTASYTDDQGTAEAVTSAATAVVTNTNNAPTGLVLITGTPAEDETLTALNNLNDIDGLGSITYQWQRNGFDIAGVTGSTYTLVQADVGSTLTVTANYTDDGGTAESVSSSATATVANVNDDPLGLPVISGSISEGQTLTVSVNDITDEDGLGSISYQWQRDDTDILGATGSTFTLAQIDVGSVIRVIASYIDGQGTAESVISLATAVVTNVNSAPTGSVTISGSDTATEGVALIASHTLQDTDGLGIITYQWQRAGINISGAVGSSYVPVLADVGSILTVIASYTDGQGTDESVISAGTRAIVADLDADGLDDDIDTDIDGDGMDNDFENAYGLDPRNPADAAQDSDGDGLTNLQEFEQGMNPVQDDIPPVILVPADITIDASGLYTFVDFGSAVAFDDLDGVVTAVSDLDNYLPPGMHVVSWSASDAAGNTAVETQTVNVVPLVEFGIDQLAVEGNTVKVKLMLNGPAVNYPVTVPYAVTGSAQTSLDHDLVNGNITINSGTEAELSFNIVDDGLGDAGETIVISMGIPANAVLGARSEHIIKIVEGNVAPQVVLTADQGAGNTHLISQLEGIVTVSANVTDPNNGDVHSYDWSETDNALVDIDASSDTFSFDSLGVTPGLYTLRLSVSDGLASDEVKIALNVVASTPVLSTNDSDGDGIDDATEGYGDSDNDGVPNYLDAIAVASVLQGQGGSSDQYLMATESGLSLSLGLVAFQANQGQAVVTSADIVNYGNAPEDDRPNVGGLFDFVISGLPEAGRSIHIVLPQLAAIPVDAEYRKLMPAGWQAFVEDDNNVIYSAGGEQGYCPPAGDPSYTPGLTAGDWCVQLLIQDGGPNDADLAVNRRVVDPGGLVQLHNITVGVKSSGGSVYISLIMFILWWSGFRVWKRRT